MTSIKQLAATAWEAKADRTSSPDEMETEGQVVEVRGFRSPERDSAAPIPWSKELVQAIAMDIGKEIAAYIEVQYPQAVHATSSTFLLSVRNSIYNEIMAAIEVNDAGQITARIKDRKDFRRKWKAQWKKIRAKDSP